MIPRSSLSAQIGAVLRAREAIALRRPNIRSAGEIELDQRYLDDARASLQWLMDNRERIAAAKKERGE